jgi:hypothetical protein
MEQAGAGTPLEPEPSSVRDSPFPAFSPTLPRYCDNQDVNAVLTQLLI